MPKASTSALTYYQSRDEAVRAESPKTIPEESGPAGRSQVSRGRRLPLGPLLGSGIPEVRKNRNPVLARPLALGPAEAVREACRYATAPLKGTGCCQ